MSRLPIRVRLTAAFALAMIVVLACAAAFVYVRMRAGLDEGLDNGLQARADAVAAIARQAAPSLGDVGAVEPEERFAAILDPDGDVVASAGAARQPVLAPAELERARAAPLTIERGVDGIEGEARILARPAGSRVVVIGESLEDRDEALAGLLASFAIGGPLAVALASLAGYGLAAAAFTPVERMRRRAAELSLDGDAGLPLPAAQDEIRRLGETLNEMLSRLRASYERERRFVADASHELRTPLAVVKTELEGALRSGDYGPQVHASLVAALEECERLVALAEDLLVMARAAGGALPTRPERAPARELLESVASRFADRAREHGRALHVEAPGDVDVWADPLRIRQALGNLVDNALRHGGGEIVLRARQAGAATELSVSDAGTGFDDAVAARAFERFARGDEARTGGGAGLGLAIVRAIAQAHGGSAEILSRRPPTVAVRLPAAPPEPLRVSSAHSRTVAETAPFKERTP